MSETISIKSIYNSPFMEAILFSLNEGKKENHELCKITGTCNTTISNLIYKLKHDQYVDKDGDHFYLTPSGKILASNINNTTIALKVIDRFKEFWEDHFIGGIPESSLNNIGDLYESTIICDTGNSYGEAMRNYLDNLKNAKKMFAVSSLTNDEQRRIMIDLLNADVSIEFVHTDTFNQKEYIERNAELIERSNFKSMVIKEETKIGLTVTDFFISFGMYKKNGKNYDTSEDLFSTDPKAIEWGMRLFQYYKAKSIPSIKNTIKK